MKTHSSHTPSALIGVLAAAILSFSLTFSSPLFAQEAEKQTDTGYSSEQQTDRKDEAEVKSENESFGDTNAEEQTEAEIQTESNEAQAEPKTQSGMGAEEGLPPMDPQMKQQEALSSADLSDEKLQAFVNSANKVMQIHEEAEEKMVQTIEENDLDVETFNKILQAKQLEQVPEAEPKEVQAFQKALPQVLDEQQRVNAKIEESLQQEGLDIETYEDIMIAYQQDPEIQQRVNELIQKREND